MRVINTEETAKRLPMGPCIDVMRDVLVKLENGTAQQYLRTMQPLPDGLLAFMPAYLDERYFGTKIITVYHKNVGTGYPSHQGSVLLYESAHGTPLASMDGGEITRIRTGAVSAVATDLLARKDASVAAFIGAGTQARSHLEAIRLVRDIKKITVYDLYPKSAQAFAEEAFTQYGVDVTVCTSPQEAVKEADIISTITMSHEPLISLADVKPGTHINAVGACTPNDRELASDLVAASKFYGDNVESVLNESGDFLLAVKDGAIASGHLCGTLGQLLTNGIKGREEDSDITVFESLGLAVEDVAAAAYIYEQML